MKKIILILLMVIAFPCFAFAQEPPTKQELQHQLELVFWEKNYCSQRLVVLQITEKEIQEMIQKMESEEKTKP